MASEFDRLLREGMTAVRAGEHEQGRDLLLQALEINDRSEQAWLWLSGAMTKREDRIVCLENVLAINPNNELAQKGLQRLGAGVPAASPPASPAPSAAEVDGAWRSPLVSPPEEPAATPAPRSKVASVSQAVIQSTPSPPRPANDGTMVREEARPQRDLLGIFDSWAAALILNRYAGFDVEMPVAGFPRLMVNYLAAAVLAAVTTGLSFQVGLVSAGGIEEMIRQSAAQQGQTVTPEMLSIFSSVAPRLGIAGAILAFFGLPLISWIDGALTQVVAGFLGGRGELRHTLQGYSIVVVVTQIVGLIPLGLSIAVAAYPPLSGMSGAISGVLSLALSVYGIILRTIALQSAHRDMGMLTALGVQFLNAILIALIATCLVVALVGLAVMGAGS